MEEKNKAEAFDYSWCAAGGKDMAHEGVWAAFL
jgi:hypothetical protein